MYLIRFEYYRRAGAYEFQSETLLVRASCFESACGKISDRYESAKNFENLTI